MEKCDYCGEESIYVPIIEKPYSYSYKGHTFLFVQAFADLSKQKIKDHVCLECLQHEIEAITESV